MRRRGIVKRIGHNPVLSIFLKIIIYNTQNIMSMPENKKRVCEYARQKWEYFDSGKKGGRQWTFLRQNHKLINATVLQYLNQFFFMEKTKFSV